MLTVLDISNHWSETGGGVRRYQLEKCAALARHEGVRHILVTPDRLRATTPMQGRVVREHVRAAQLPGTGGYRYLLRAEELASVMAEHRPQIVVCGSPLIMPSLVRRALGRAGVDAALVGFWHSDFPRTYFARAAARVDRRLAGPAESAGWAWARHAYADFDATLVASRGVGEVMLRHGLGPLYYSPLGVDSQSFVPQKRQEDLRRRVQGGNPERKVIFFPHRFCEEKGLAQTLAAYEILASRCERELPMPALVFAGSGPQLQRVHAAVERFPHVHHLGYLHGIDELASWYASSDLCLSLSAWETFGLSTAEAMASGLAIISAREGAAPEFVREARCGLTVDREDPRALADAIDQLIASAELPTMAARARRHVEALTWAATFERELAVYRKLLRLRRAGRKPAKGLHAAADELEAGAIQGQASRAKATSSRAEAIQLSSIG